MSEKEINFNTIKNGYLVVPNFLKKNQLEDLKNSLLKQELNKEVFNVFEEKSLFNFVTNDKLLEIIKKFVGDKVYFLYSSSFLNDTLKNKYSWHRDNPCRQTGVGPDWDKDLDYNVVSVALYLNNTNDTSTGLSLIPNSHINKYNKTISNLLRWCHWKLKQSNCYLLRKIIERLVSKRLRYNEGDLIIFYCNIFHTGFLDDYFANNATGARKAIITRFGGSGKHSLNFMNYELNYRDIKNKLTKSSKYEDFIQLLKKKKIYLEPDYNFKTIKGIHIPKKK